MNPLCYYVQARETWLNPWQTDDAQTRKILNNLIVAFGLTDRKSKIHFWWTSLNFLFKNKANNMDPRCISVLQLHCLKYFKSPLVTSRFVLQLGNSESWSRCNLKKNCKKRSETQNFFLQWTNARSNTNSFCIQMHIYTRVTMYKYKMYFCMTLCLGMCSAHLPDGVAFHCRAAFQQSIIILLWRIRSLLYRRGNKIKKYSSSLPLARRF